MFGYDFGFTTLGARRGETAFSPGKLPGLVAWYDPSDLSTLYQDTAMTVPVTAAGQAVAAMRDKSGNGAHMLQATASKRPIYHVSGGLKYVEFDGVDDGMSAAACPMAGADEVTLSTAVRGVSTGTIGTLCELSAISSNTAGTFGFFEEGVQVGAITWRSKGTSDSLKTVARGAVLPATSVYSCMGKISTDLSVVRRNGAVLLSAATDQGSGAFISGALYLGARGGSTYFFRGNLYGMCLLNKVQTAPDILRLETYWSKKAGL